MRRGIAFVPLAACASPGNATIANAHDACTPPSVVAASATAVQQDGITAAEALWRGRGAPELGMAQGAALEVRFQTASLAFYGFYDDGAGVIYINDQVTDPTELSIVIAHELGHAFGLVHVSPDQRISLMNPGNTATPPTADDQHAIEALWGVCP